MDNRQYLKPVRGWSSQGGGGAASETCWLVNLGVEKKSIDCFEEAVRKLKFFLVLWVFKNSNNHIKEKWKPDMFHGYHHRNQHLYCILGTENPNLNNTKTIRISSDLWAQI